MNLVYQLKDQDVIKRSTVSIMKKFLTFGERDSSKIFVDDTKNMELVVDVHKDAVEKGQWLIPVKNIAYDQDKKTQKDDDLVALIDNTEESVQINRELLNKIFDDQDVYKQFEDIKKKGTTYSNDCQYSFCLVAPHPCSEYYDRFGIIEFHLGLGVIMLKPHGYLIEYML